MDINETNNLIDIRHFLQVNLENRAEIQSIVDVASKLCEKQFAALGLIDEEFNWLKVRSGTDVEKMPRNTSFC